MGLSMLETIIQNTWDHAVSEKYALQLMGVSGCDANSAQRILSEFPGNTQDKSELIQLVAYGLLEISDGTIFVPERHRATILCLQAVKLRSRTLEYLIGKCYNHEN